MFAAPCMFSRGATEVMSRTADFEELRHWAANAGIEVADDQLDALANYTESLISWSQRIDLVGPSEAPLLVRKHLADSLFAAAHCPDTGRLVDLGSGAGLPGIPVAIVRPATQVDLVEARAKRSSFLKVASQSLPDVRVLNCRIEELPPGGYDFALARALAPLARLLPMARRVLRDKGTLLAMTSQSVADEPPTEVDPAHGFSLAAVVEYTLPTGEARALRKYRALPADHRPIP